MRFKLIQSLIILFMNQNEQKKYNSLPKIQSVKFIQRSNGTIKGYSVNTFHGLVKNYNQDRVSIIMNITKPNFKGRWPRCSYFGVFDGHGGNKCSDFLKENMHRYITQNSHFPHQPIEALKFGFKKAQQQFLSYAQAQDPVERSGSCAIVLLIIDQICYVANVGDSRAILSANMGKNVYPISKDHKPDSQTQKQRIFNAGGRIYQSSMKNKSGQIILGPFRIQPGKLSVSRSFGDIQAKLAKYEGNAKVLIAKPQITYFQINSEQHDFIIMCSDGVYDKLSNQEVAQCFWNQRQKNTQEDINKEKYQFIGTVPSKIIERSMQKLSMDNLTCLVIVFEDQGKLLLPSKKKHSKVGQKESGRIRPQTSCQQDLQNKFKYNNNISANTIKLTGGKLIQQSKTSRSSKLQQNLMAQNMNKQTSNHNLNNRDKQNTNQNKMVQQKDTLQKMLKRKSTSNLLTSKDSKYDSHQNNNNSLNNSISAKMLGIKAINKQNKAVKQGLVSDKININDFLHKKKSMDYLRRQSKDSLWKQMISTAKGDKNQKLIRF